MRRLTLIRHAKSDWSDPDLNDFDRPLNERGKKAAPLMGKRLASRSHVPDLLVSSPAKRARKTAQLIAKELGLAKTDIRFDEVIYEAPVDNLLEVLKALPDDCHPALIGHNPGLSDLGSWLCQDAPSWLKTCAVLTLELEADSWQGLTRHCATLLEYDYPKKKD